MPRWSVLAMLLMLAAPAWALDCKTATNQASLNECAGKDFKAADDQLNALYKQAQDRLAHPATPDAKALLTEAQRAWIAFRDAECKFRSSDSEGGSIYPMTVLGCRTEITLKRVADFKHYLSCKPEEGDCPTAPMP